ncbi:carbamoyltransferase HypF [Lachnoclostridium sp. Marseille-P6806]|uniref:carbamoyltransferase HypF n=1 Tax=Lachnoclostridium sp. Marseille-P6806 TaxID=2364793 RepID=UPI0013EF3186|nr:carbamoyltransferase HypF [Lachnoclostridium sp. Marseille-P6806]
MLRLHIRVTGAVQGIGYRPFVVGLAERLHVRGTVRNAGGVVEIEAAGESAALRQFRRSLVQEVPPGGVVLGAEETPGEGELPPGFRIEESTEDTLEEGGSELPVFPPDLALCRACERELLSPGDRRYRYPLISCVSCGPRYSILKRFPYDRETTAMTPFSMCPSCGAEYHAAGRRRHAQTISCHGCGPQMLLRRYGVGEDISGEEAMREAVRLLRGGGILAVKGIGGYQLLCRADDRAAVFRIRELKGREKKPFAVMVPDLRAAEALALLSEREKELLSSAARPIVLVERSSEETDEADGGEDVVSSGSRFLGLMLPSTGVHRLLAGEIPAMVVTSANRTGEPIPIRDETFLGPVCAVRPDAVLYHRREILRPLDDSVIRAEEDGGICMIRRSRGYVPFPVFLRELPGEGDAPQRSRRTIFAAGGDLKSAFALRRGVRAILSQYFGDLEHYDIFRNYSREERAMEALFSAEPELAVCDLHSGYHSSAFAERYARARGIPLVRVQHHHAHCASVMAEHGLLSALGIAFDGTGYGTDGALWGGEFLLCRGGTMERRGSLSPVLLMGGDSVSFRASLAADCYRAALGERTAEPLTAAALRSGENTIRSTSAGRLFDAMSSLLGIRQENSYEGECASALEKAAWEYESRGPGGGGREYPLLPEVKLFRSAEDGRWLLDQLSLVHRILSLRESGATAGECALEFHEALARAAGALAERIAGEAGERRIVLGGGVFVNRLFLRRLSAYLRGRGFSVYRNEQIPGNDGGLALGQAWLAGFYSGEKGE